MFPRILTIWFGLEIIHGRKLMVCSRIILAIKDVFGGRMFGKKIPPIK